MVIPFPLPDPEDHDFDNPDDDIIYDGFDRWFACWRESGGHFEEV